MAHLKAVTRQEWSLAQRSEKGWRETHELDRDAMIRMGVRCCEALADLIPENCGIHDPRVGLPEVGRVGSLFSSICLGGRGCRQVR